MKITSLSLMPTDNKNATLSALTVKKLESLWQVNQAPLGEALQHLTAQDLRHELTLCHGQQISLLEWLNLNFDALMQAHAEHTKLGRAVCASLWHKQLVELIFPTLVALRFQYHLVPDFCAESILLDIETNGRIKTISIADTAIQNDTAEALDEKLRLQIHAFAESLLAIFAEQKVNTRRFWGNLSNALAQGFTRLSDKQKISEDLSKEINAWLHFILGEAQALVEVKAIGVQNNQALFARRKICCLKYKLNKDRMCKTCNLVDEAKQESFYQDKYS